jgi:hypothetical protein
MPISSEDPGGRSLPNNGRVGVHHSSGPANVTKPKSIGPPTNVKLIPLHTAVSVSWTAPDDPSGQPIEGYIVTATHRKATTVSCDAGQPDRF